MSEYQEQCVKYKAEKIGQIDARPVGRRKSHTKHANGWQVVVPPWGPAGQPWVRRYATEAIARQVAEAYNRRFAGRTGWRVAEVLPPLSKP